MQLAAAPVALVLAVLLPGMAAAQNAEPAALRVVLCGDSTMCEYPAKGPLRGWGQCLRGCFDDGVEVINLAQGGRSTKTFRADGRWQKALAARPAFVLIQFGHNDSHAPDRPESTDAATDFPANLRLFVAEALAAGALPILLTPVVRRVFRPDGTLVGELAPYAEATRRVAAEMQVPLVDVQASSLKLVESLGPERSAAMANEPGDHTHFNEHGARAMAELVIQELPAVVPALARHLVPRHVMPAPAVSPADAPPPPSPPSPAAAPQR
jgi:lysophospholipase L1-like esterase